MNRISDKNMGRKMSYKYLLIILFLTAGFFHASAEEIFNLDKARALALSASKELAIAAKKMNTSELKRAALKYSWYPDISLAGSYRYSDNGVMEDYTPSASISLQQQIWDGGVYSAEKKIAEADNDIALYEWEEMILTVSRECDNLYYSYAEALSRADTAKAAFEASEALRDYSLAKYESGIISRVSYLQMRSDTASKETDYLDARRDSIIAGNILASFLGLDVLPESLETIIPSYEKYLDSVNSYIKNNMTVIPEKLFLEGLKNSPSLRNSEKTVQQREFEKSLKIRELNPRLSLSAARTYSGDEIEGLVQNSSITLSASLTLSQWNRANQLKQADFSISNAELTLDEARRKYSLEINSAWLNLLSSAQAAYSAGLAADYADEYYNEVYERYMLASETVSSLKDAESDKTAAKTSFLKAKYDFLQTISAILYLLGFENENRLFEFIGIGQLSDSNNGIF